jgi:2-methylcitrate dehydratase PrpD
MKHVDLEDRLLDYLINTQYDSLPPGVVEHCKLLILDSIGVALAGCNAPGCAAVADMAGDWGAASGGSTVLLHGFKTSPPLAALSNSTLMHSLDFDDTLDASALHTFVSVLPSALATAEAMGNVDGKRFITALVLGADIICRLSLGIQRPLSWIRSATCGSFGAAATAAKILGLDRDGISDSMGIVYSQTSGNAQGLIEGRLVKRMQPGFAACSGVTSAFLAKAGITGSRQFLTGIYGFYNLYERGDYHPEVVVDRLGEAFPFLDLSIKPYPCCRMTHSSIDLALALRGKIEDRMDRIEHIAVTVSEMVKTMVGRPLVFGTNPQVDAQFSIPYTVSVALCRGDVFLHDFEIPALQNERVVDLAGRVVVDIDAGLAPKDILCSSLQIRMKDGTVYKASTKAPLGNPANPIGIDGCREKFLKCISYSGLPIDRSKQQKLFKTIEHLDQLNDVRQLIELVQI